MYVGVCLALIEPNKIRRRWCPRYNLTYLLLYTRGTRCYQTTEMELLADIMITSSVRTAKVPAAAVAHVLCSIGVALLALLYLTVSTVCPKPV